MYKSILYIRWIVFQVYSKIIFKIERFLYKKLSNKKIKHRIFFSSGNISLINVLTIIKQFPENNTEDILVIDTPLGSKNFIKINKEIAKYHKFKKIIISKKAPSNRTYFNIMYNNLFNIDEVFAHTKLEYLIHVFPMFKDCKITIFDEGMASLIEQYHPNDYLITDLNTMKYCNKFDRLGFDNIPIKNLDIKIFKEIAENIDKEYPFDLEIDKESKTIMFCGAYWQAFNMGKYGFYSYQNGIMQKFLDNGFDVIYKPHPRDEVDIKLPEKVRITNSLLPLELYNLDLLAIVSIASTASIHPFHYWNIAGFVDINEKTFYDKESLNFIDINRKILDLYIPNISELLKINASDYTKQELKTKINKIFEDKLVSQPMLSKNNVLREYYEQYRKQEDTKFGSKR